MKILHTSDWHIGKRLAGKERLDEQCAVLNEIAEICGREGVDLVLVAGDIFDTYLPSSKAENLFYSAVKKIAGKDRCVLAISGNHDDNVRLTAACALAEEQGIYLYGNQPHVPMTGGERAVCAVEAGPEHIVFRGRKGDLVYVNVLPYPNEARLGEENDPDESFLEKMRRWMERGQAYNTKALPSVFLSHLFVAGGSVSEGEREIDLGGARAVPLDLLPKCDYTALGHLHKRQRLRDNVYYSGSLLQYSFDEANIPKSVAILKTEGDKVVFEKEVPLTSGRKLVRLEAAGAEQALALLRRYENAFVELTLHLNAPLTAQETLSLREANEGLVSLIVRTQTAVDAPEIVRSALSSEELFVEYYKSVYGEPPSDELKEAFLELLGEGA